MYINKVNTMSVPPHRAWWKLVIKLILICQCVNHISCTGLTNHDHDRKVPIAYKELTGSSFIIYRKRMSWENALVFCSKCVGNFATFDSVEIANKLIDLIYNISHFSEEFDYGEKLDEYGLNRRYWFGLHDQKLKEGVWKWVKSTRVKPQPVDNVDTYPWYTNQPDHHEEDAKHKAEHCVGLWNPVYHLDSKPGRLEKHTFNDMDCDGHYYFICEKTDPPPYAGNEPEFCKTPSSHGK